MRTPTSRALTRGFTLVELLAVLAIVAVISAIGVPSLVSFVQAGQMRAATFDLVNDLAFARSEAIKRNGDVVLEQVSAGQWTGGWRVRAGTAADAPILRERSGVTAQLRWTAGVNSFVFGGNGRLQGVDGVTTISLCSPDGSVGGRAVQVQLSGLARSVKGGCNG
jgi:type IV fimbrial biogenesis protein FimT